MSGLYSQSEDTRAAIRIYDLILARAAEWGKLDDPSECTFIDLVDISILPAVRVAEQWHAVERAGGEQQQLIRGTLVIIGLAIEMYTARALALLPPQLVAQGRALIVAENRRNAR